MQQIKIKSCRLFVMANNLFTITKYSGIDPEVGSSYSQASLNGYVGTAVGVTTRGLDAVSQYPQTKDLFRRYRYQFSIIGNMDPRRPTAG